MYKCGECHRTLEELDPTTNRCPYCGSRILYKIRPDVIREVKAR